MPAPLWFPIIVGKSPISAHPLEFVQFCSCTHLFFFFSNFPHGIWKHNKCQILQKVIVSITASAAKSLLSSPRGLIYRSSSLQQIKRQCHHNVTQPGDQWRAIGIKSRDGRGRPNQLPSLCVDSEYSLHPGSCWDLRGVLSAQADVAPGTLVNHGKPSGAFSWKGLHGLRHSQHQLNQPVSLWVELCFQTTRELFLYLNTELSSHEKSKVLQCEQPNKLDEEIFFLWVHSFVIILHPFKRSTFVIIPFLFTSSLCLKENSISGI